MAETIKETIGPTEIKIGEVRMEPSAVHLQYVDGAIGLISDGVLVKFNLYQDIPTGTDADANSPQITRVVVSRLVMSVAALTSVHEWLGRAVAQLKATSRPPEENA